DSLSPDRAAVPTASCGNQPADIRLTTRRTDTRHPQTHPANAEAGAPHRPVDAPASPCPLDRKTYISALAPLMRRGEKPGFVVEDMTDVDAFGPTGVDLPDSPLYLIHAPDRGDEFENASPAEALEAIAAGGRSPLLLTEGLLWVLQVPDVLERNHCFMTIGSRIRKASGQLDSRSEERRVGKERRRRRSEERIQENTEQIE